MGSVVIAGITVWNQAITGRRVDATERRIEAIGHGSVERDKSLKPEVKEEIHTMKKELETLIKGMLKSSKGGEWHPQNRLYARNLYPLRSTARCSITNPGS